MIHNLEIFFCIMNRNTWFIPQSQINHYVNAKHAKSSPIKKAFIMKEILIEIKHKAVALINEFIF